MSTETYLLRAGLYTDLNNEKAYWDSFLQESETIDFCLFLVTELSDKLTFHQ